MMTTLEHKLLADHYGCLGDQYAEAGDAAASRAAYTQQAHHLNRGKQLGEQQPWPVLLASLTLWMKS